MDYLPDPEGGESATGGRAPNLSIPETTSTSPHDYRLWRSTYQFTNCMTLGLPHILYSVQYVYGVRIVVVKEAKDIHSWLP